MSLEQDLCKHENFKAQVNVSRLHSEIDKPNNITGYSADVTIKCGDCGLPFQFIGLPGGSSPNHPMVSADMTELRAPIVPQSDKLFCDSVKHEF